MVFCTASPANHHPWNLNAKFKIKSIGHFKTKSLISGFYFYLFSCSAKCFVKVSSHKQLGRFPFSSASKTSTTTKWTNKQKTHTCKTTKERKNYSIHHKMRDWQNMISGVCKRQYPSTRTTITTPEKGELRGIWTTVFLQKSPALYN